MKTAVLFQHYRTGNREARDYCAIQCRNDPQLVQFYDAVQPLDAPDYLPAGSCTSTDYTNWRGRPIASQSKVSREAA